MPEINIKNGKIDIKGSKNKLGYLQSNGYLKPYFEIEFRRS